MFCFVASLYFVVLARLIRCWVAFSFSPVDLVAWCYMALCLVLSFISLYFNSDLLNLVLIVLQGGIISDSCNMQCSWYSGSDCYGDIKTQGSTWYVLAFFRSNFHLSFAPIIYSSSAFLVSSARAARDGWILCFAPVRNIPAQKRPSFAATMLLPLWIMSIMAFRQVMELT